MNKIDLSKYNNSWYKPGSKFKILIWYFFSRAFINTSFPFPMVLKKTILKMFGAKIGKGVILKQNILIKYPWFLEIEENAWIGEYVWIDNLAPIFIGKNVTISQGAMLLTGNHNFKTTTFDLMLGEIKIDEGAWIGAKSIVCPGVIVATHAVLSVGGVATKNLNSYTIYKGNPATEVGKRVINGTVK